MTFSDDMDDHDKFIIGRLVPDLDIGIVKIVEGLIRDAKSKRAEMQRVHEQHHRKTRIKEDQDE